MKASKARKAGSGRQETGPRIVFVTVPSIREGRRIAKSVVAKRLAACVNLWPSPVSSIYRWKQKVEVANEYLMVIKTMASGYAALEEEIARMHSYDVPEIVALPITAGSSKYLAWLRESVG
jgi:periplasmic divalent cation tolerance protein